MARTWPAPTVTVMASQRTAGWSPMEMGHAGLVIVKPMDMVRPGMAGTNLTALPGAGRGRGAAVGRNFADRQRFAAVFGGVD